MLAVERPETPKYKLCKGREEGGGGGRLIGWGRLLQKIRYICAEYVDNTSKLKYWLKIRHNPHFYFKTGDVENTSAHYTRQTKKMN